MRLETRKILDKAFTGVGSISIFIMAGALIVILMPMFFRGIGAFVFRETIEHQRFLKQQDLYELYQETMRGGVSLPENLKELVGNRQSPGYLEYLIANRQEELGKIDRDNGDAPGTAEQTLNAYKQYRILWEEMDAFSEQIGDHRVMEEWEKRKAIAEKLDSLEGAYPRVRALKQHLLARDKDFEVALQKAQEARKPVYAMLAELETQADSLPVREKYKEKRKLKKVREVVQEILGPDPEEDLPVLPRDQYGVVRTDRLEAKMHELLYVEKWVASQKGGMRDQKFVPRREEMPALAPLIDHMVEHKKAMLQPHWTFYGGFLFDNPVDSNMLGGIWPMLLGTIYLTVGAMLIATPFGVIAAIYFIEYAGTNWFVSFLRICVSTLAGVPSIVFGLFGLAFFINTINVSENRSVLAGSLTLALLVLPTVIRASEEAIRAVPQTYREASLALGASRWKTITKVILPASLSGILTGIIISMGRAAGETAPIIFTAAVSTGSAIAIWDVFTQPTPALPWNIYNLATEHEAVEEIRHVQYGMVLVLVVLVLLLNLLAIIMRARISKKLRG